MHLHWKPLCGFGSNIIYVLATVENFFDSVLYSGCNRSKTMKLKYTSVWVGDYLHLWGHAYCPVMTRALTPSSICCFHNIICVLDFLFIAWENALENNKMFFFLTGCQVVEQQKITSCWDINVQSSFRYERYTAWWVK